MINKVVHSLLLRLQPETAHEVALILLKVFYCCVPKICCPVPLKPIKLMGIEFPNPVGVAGGLDKNADYFSELAKCGFGFIEVGTVTPKLQLGNPKPRLFRLLEDQAIINRMGFNNKGINYLVERIKHSKIMQPLGVNIGKNKITPIENAVDDYLYCFEKVYNYADYITINISSPNTEKLRSLQQENSLLKLLTTLKSKQKQLNLSLNKYVPILVKVAPDLNDDEINIIANCLKKTEIDGLITCNTSIRRENLNSVYANEKGGISGKPITSMSDQNLAKFRLTLGLDFPIIGVGGIMTVEDAKQRLAQGANLIQLYSGLVYKGIGLAKEIIHAI